MGYDDRRIEVANAAWQVILREGLDRTSMRAIAHELGSSTGVVTHYFRNKEDLVLFALQKVFENTVEHMQASAEGLEGIDRLEHMLIASLPLTPSDQHEWKVWIAFLGHSVGREHLMLEHQKRYNLLRQVLHHELSMLQSAMLLPGTLDTLLEADTLIALVDGIGTRIVVEPERFSAEQQKFLIQRHIAGLQAGT
jgi:AcrR family transcriptional regulator